MYFNTTAIYLPTSTKFLTNSTNKDESYKYVGQFVKSVYSWIVECDYVIQIII